MIVVVAVVVGRAAVIKDVVIAALADIDDKADVLARELPFGKKHRLSIAVRALEDEFVAHVFLLDGEFEFELALLRLIFDGGALDALPVFIAGIDVFAFNFLPAVLVFRFVLLRHFDIRTFRLIEIGAEEELALRFVFFALRLVIAADGISPAFGNKHAFDRILFLFFVLLLLIGIQNVLVVVEGVVRGVAQKVGIADLHAVSIFLIAFDGGRLDGVFAQKPLDERHIAVDRFDMLLFPRCVVLHRADGGSIAFGREKGTHGSCAVRIKGLRVRDICKLIAARKYRRRTSRKGEREHDGKHEQDDGDRDERDHHLALLLRLFAPAVGAREHGRLFRRPVAELLLDALSEFFVREDVFCLRFEHFPDVFHALSSSKCVFSFLSASLLRQVTVPMGMPSILETSRRL